MMARSTVPGTKCWWAVSRPLVLVLFVFLLGCASYTVPAAGGPQPWLKRLDTQDNGVLRISAVVLSADESRLAFGVKLAARGIQPIWLEIENRGDREHSLMLNSIDPDYYSPSEVAWTTRGFGETVSDAKLMHFVTSSISPRVMPGSTNKGFVFTHLDPGGKAFDVELVGERSLQRFEFVQQIPGQQMDWMNVDFENLYDPADYRDLDASQLRDYLESLTCCALGGDRKTPGDPLNIVVIGDGKHMLLTFLGQGWDMTETITTGTAAATAASSVFGGHYRTSPISPLYLFDRSQDLALQKIRGSVDERNHFRLWMAPVSFNGQPVWVGQISRDLGVKLSSKTIVTHKVDPFVDEARYYLGVDLASSQSISLMGYTRGVGASRRSAPRENYTKDPYYTDGLRLVVFLTRDSVALDEIQWLDWEIPPQVETYIDDIVDTAR
jgi:hypothetical protein